MFGARSRAVATAPAGIRQITVAAGDGRTLYAACGKEGVATSTDNGATWTAHREGFGPKDELIELVADPTLPAGTNASRLEIVGDSGEINLQRLGRSMPDNPKTGVLTALTMADDLMKMVRASDW